MLATQVPAVQGLALAWPARLPFLGARVAHLRAFLESSRRLFALGPLVLAIGMGVVSWGAECVAFYLVLVGLGVTAGGELLLQAAFVLASATIVGSASMLPGGLAVAEGGITGMLLAARDHARPRDRGRGDTADQGRDALVRGRGRGDRADAAGPTGARAGGAGQEVGRVLIRVLIALLIVAGSVLPVAAAPSTVTPLPPVANSDPFFGSVQAVYAADAAQRAGVKWERLGVLVVEDAAERAGRRPARLLVHRRPDQPGDRARLRAGRGRPLDPRLGGPRQRGRLDLGPAEPRPAGDRARELLGAVLGPAGRQVQGPDRHLDRLEQPDMYKGNDRRTWSGGVDDYYKLLKAAYLGAKSTNPNARIIVSGMTYWWDKENGRRQFVDELLERIAADPSAPANGYYFDGLSVHAYANPLNSFTIPTIYRGYMRARGIDKPIWIQESNVVPKDDPVQPTNGPFRASLDEQASYVIEATALARAAGVERAAIYKMNDTGGENGELYGLVRDDGSARPAYVAYQVAATYFSNVRSASSSWTGAEPPSSAQLDALLRSNEGRFQFVWPAAVNKVVLDRGSTRVTVVWNGSAQRATARVPAAAARARLVDKLGVARDVAPTDGAYQLDLEPSTNNSDPRDGTLFLVGGSPLILVEETGGAPAPTPAATATPAPVAGAAPSPPPAGGVDARIEIVFPQGGAPVTQADRANVSAFLFQSGGRAPVACDYGPTVRLWAGLNNDPARPVAIATRRLDESGGRTLPAYEFNDVDVSAARNPRNKLYFFVTIDGQRQPLDGLEPRLGRADVLPRPRHAERGRADPAGRREGRDRLAARQPAGPAGQAGQRDRDAVPARDAAGRERASIRPCG